MNVRILPHPLCGTVAAPYSKSEIHRLLIAAAFGKVPVRLKTGLLGSDNAKTASCLAALGASVRQNGVYTEVVPIKKAAEEASFYCGGSAATIRFLLPVAATVCKKNTFTGHESLSGRPLSPILSVLKEHGLTVDGDILPIKTEGLLPGGIYEAEGCISSQFASGLLMALPLCREDSILRIKEPLVSASYLGMTEAVLQKSGIRYEKNGLEFRIRGGQRYMLPTETAAEGDWSGAAYFLAAESFGGNVSVSGLSTESRQGDRAVLTLLERFRAGGDITVDIRDIPDLLPILAAAAAVRRGRTVFEGTKRLRYKESDRVWSTVKMLESLGGDVTAEADSVCVSGGSLIGGTVNGYKDHRIVMAAAVAAQCCREPVCISDAEAVEKSYPAFWEDYQAAGGIVYEL